MDSVHIAIIVIPINFDPVKPLFLFWYFVFCILFWLHSLSCIPYRTTSHNDTTALILTRCYDLDMIEKVYFHTCYTLFYHVKVITSGEDQNQSSCIIMRCNPVWNTTETMQSKQNTKYQIQNTKTRTMFWLGHSWLGWQYWQCVHYPCYTWFTLWGGQILYSDQSTDLLASVRSLCLMKSLK